MSLRTLSMSLYLIGKTWNPVWLWIFLIRRNIVFIFEFLCFQVFGIPRCGDPFPRRLYPDLFIHPRLCIDWIP